MSTYDSNAFEFYNDLVLATAVRLIKNHGATTTLEIKEELRVRHNFIEFDNVSFKPSFTQQQVSDSMEWLASNSYFNYNFNGTHRIYSLNTIEFNDKEDSNIGPISLSVQEALETISDLDKNDDITITFTKLDDSIRTIKGTVYSPNIGLGHMLVYDMELPNGPTGNNIRSVDLRRLISFELENVVYTIDKNIR